MKSYFRIMLGKQSVYAEECFAGNFVAFTSGPACNLDLSDDLPEDWRDFNKKFVPKILALTPERSKISAGLECGFLWTVCRGISVGDVVICPDGFGSYRVGEVVGNYSYVEGPILQHRRPVQHIIRH